MSLHLIFMKIKLGPLVQSDVTWTPIENLTVYALVWHHSRRAHRVSDPPVRESRTLPRLKGLT